MKKAVKCLFWTAAVGLLPHVSRAGDAASTRPAATRYYSGVCAGHPDDGFPAHDRRREEPEGGVL